MGPGLAAVLQELRLLQGPVCAISTTRPEVRIAAVSGRVWRVSIDGGREPPSVRAADKAAVRAAVGAARAAIEAGKDLESIGPVSVRLIRDGLDSALVAGLRRIDALGVPPHAWRYSEDIAPSRATSLRGQTIERLIELFNAAEGRPEVETMANLDVVLNRESQKVPDCVAAGYVDMESGMLLAVRTVDRHPPEILDLVAAATADVMQGPAVTQIEQGFRRSRGQPENGEHYFDMIIMRSKALIHALFRSNRNPNHTIVFVCRATANLGAVLSKAALAAQEIEKAA